MLKRIRLTDFKSFVDEEVELAPLTLLVGANAAGKSNLFDAIRFLKGLPFLTLSEVLQGEERSGPDAWPGIRGRAEETVRIGCSSFALETQWSGYLGAEVENIHRIVCRPEPAPALISERILRTGSVEVVLEAKAISGELTASWQVPDNSGSTALPSTDLSLLSLFFANGRFSPDLPVGAVALGWSMRIFLAMVRFVDIRPEAMRGYGRRGAPLGDEGKNLSGVLADICSKPDAKQSLVDWLAELCAPELEDIDIVEVKQLGDVMAFLIEKGGRRISARSVSDGTLRFLGTLLALRTAEPGSVILIEEIESGLHPTRIRLLVEYLEAVTRERGIQVIATTHSPVVLEWLSAEALRSALVFGRIPEREGTVVRRLGDLPHFNEVVQRKGIDELFTTGWLEMAL